MVKLCVYLIAVAICYLSLVECGNENYTVDPNMASYEEVKDIPNHPEKYLIEVRNPDELEKTGRIPASINVPLPELNAALQLDSQTFESKYGRAKPAKDAVIIFTCQSGRRAALATEQAKKQGYINSKPYSGSWLEWSKKEGL